ncbi:MAG: hypothetical protein C5B51_01995 [Terriglobia bacterium]|nr:MAG: hypothetical protein C5B51_01995 [Terriglobia bacterium]
MERPRRVILVLAVVAGLAGCTRSAGDYLQRGNRLAAQGSYADAVLQYRKALQKNPRYGEAYFRMGLASLQQGDAEAAYSALNEAVRLMPANETAKVKLADLNMAAYLKDPNRSERFYRRVESLAREILEKDAGSAEGLRLMGALALLDHRPQNALGFYRKAIQRAPDNLDIVEGLVQALLQNGDFNEGEHVALNFVEKNPTAEAVYDILYRFYAGANQNGAAEAILKRKIQNNPKKALYRLQLAQHYARFNQSAEMAAALAGLLENQKDFPLAHLQVGDFYNALGNRAEALRQYELGAQNPSRERIVYQKRVGDVLLAEGRREDAARVIDTILRDQPKDADALRVRAEIWLESRKPEERSPALLELQKLAIQNPADAAIVFDLGRAYLLNGDWRSAQKNWQTAASLRPTFRPPRYALAELNLEQGRPQETLRRAEEILIVQPNDTRGRFLRGAALTALERYGEARPVLTALAREFPDSTDVQLQLGILDIRENKISAAETRFRTLKPDSPNDLRPAMALAEIYSTQEQFDTALHLLQQAWKNAPDSSLIGSLAAFTALRARKYDVGIDAYRRLLVRAPQSAALYRSLAEAYLMAGRYNDAAAAAQQGHQVDPKDPRLELLVASGSRLAGRTADVRERLEHALQLDPNNPALANNLAYALADDGVDLDRALGLAQRAVQSARDEPSFADTLGWVYFKKHMWDAALQVFTALSQKYPDNASFRYHLGAVLAAKGDRRRAQTELNAALSLHPDRADEGKIRELLNGLI